MTTRSFLTVAASAAAAAVTLPLRLGAQTPPADLTQTGSIAAQVAGRVLVGLDGAVDVLIYFLFVDGIGGDLFAGQPSERTAHFTLRADRLRPVPVLNGDVAHISFLPAGGEGLYRVFYDPSPRSRDFARPETFSTGQQIAAFRTRRTQATLVSSSHTLVTGTTDLVQSAEFTFGDRKIDVGPLFKAITFTFHAKAFQLAELGSAVLSLPLGGHIVKVG